MAMETVYYCWACDAHRVAQTLTGQKVTCPCCAAELAEESRLATAPLRVGLAGMLVQIKRRSRPLAAGRPLAKGA